MNLSFAVVCTCLWIVCPAHAAEPMRFSLCTSETPFMPLSSVDPEHPGRSQILLGMVAENLKAEITHLVAPWKRCQMLVERGIVDAVNIAGYAGINAKIAVFPMNGNLPDTSKSLGSVPSFLYRRVGDSVDFVGGRIVNTQKPVAVLTARQVNMDAIQRAGATSEDGARTVSALAQKLMAGHVDLAASAEPDMAELVATRYKGELEALPTPLIESHYYVAFSMQYVSSHQAEAQAFWSELARIKSDSKYLRKISGIR